MSHTGPLHKVVTTKKAPCPKWLQMFAGYKSKPNVFTCCRRTELPGFCFFSTHNFKCSQGKTWISIHIMNISGDSIISCVLFGRSPVMLKTEAAFSSFFFLLYLKAKRRRCFSALLYVFSLTLERRGAWKAGRPRFLG